MMPVRLRVLLTPQRVAIIGLLTFGVLALLTTGAFAAETTPSLAGCADDYHECLPAWRWRDSAGGFSTDFGIFDVGAAAASSVPKFLFSVANMIWGITLWLTKEATSLDVASMGGIGQVVNEGFVAVAESVSRYLAPLILIVGIMLVVFRQVKGGKSARGWNALIRPIANFALLFTMLIFTSASYQAPGESPQDPTSLSSPTDAVGAGNEFGRQVPVGSPSWILAQTYRLSDGVTDSLASSFLETDFFQPDAVNEWNRLDCAYYVEGLHTAALNSKKFDEYEDALAEANRQGNAFDASSIERDQAMLRINTANASMLSRMWERGYLRAYVRTQFSDSTAGWRSYCWYLEDQARINEGIQRAVIASNGGPGNITDPNDVRSFVDGLGDIAVGFGVGADPFGSAAARAKWAAHGVCTWSNEAPAEREWDLGAYYGLRDNPISDPINSDLTHLSPGAGGYFAVAPDAQYVHVGATKAFFGDDNGWVERAFGYAFDAAPDLLPVYGNDAGVVGGLITRELAPSNQQEWAEWCEQFWTTGNFRADGSPLTFTRSSEWVAATRNLNDLLTIVALVFSAVEEAAGIDIPFIGGIPIAGDIANDIANGAANLSVNAFDEVFGDGETNSVTDLIGEQQQNTVRWIVEHHESDPAAAQGMTYAQYDTRAYFAGLAGHGLGDGMGAGFIALIVSIIYLLAFGGMSAGLIVAQIGIVAFVIILPLFLVVGMWPSEQMGEKVGKGLRFGFAMAFARTVMALLLGIFTVVTSVIAEILDTWQTTDSVGPVDNVFASVSSPLAAVSVPGSGMGDAMVAALPPIIAYFLLKWAAKEAGFGNPFSAGGAMKMVSNAGRYAMDPSSHRPGRMTSMARTYMNPLSMYGPMSMRRWAKKGINAAKPNGQDRKDRSQPPAHVTGAGAGPGRGGRGGLGPGGKDGGGGRPGPGGSGGKDGSGRDPVWQPDGSGPWGNRSRVDALDANASPLEHRLASMGDRIDAKKAARLESSWGSRLQDMRRANNAMKDSDIAGVRFLHRTGARVAKLGGAGALLATAGGAGVAPALAMYGGYRGLKSVAGSLDGSETARDYALNSGNWSPEMAAEGMLGAPPTVPSFDMPAGADRIDYADMLADAGSGPLSGAPTLPDISIEGGVIGGGGPRAVAPTPSVSNGWGTSDAGLIIPDGSTAGVPSVAAGAVPAAPAQSLIAPPAWSNDNGQAEAAAASAVAAAQRAEAAVVAAQQASGASWRGAGEAQTAAVRSGTAAAAAEGQAAQVQQSVMHNRVLNEDTRESVKRGVEQTRDVGVRMRDEAARKVRDELTDHERRRRAYDAGRDLNGGPQ